MKKLVLAVAVIATMGIASCGGPSICECYEINKEDSGFKMPVIKTNLKPQKKSGM